MWIIMNFGTSGTPYGPIWTNMGHIDRYNYHFISFVCGFYVVFTLWLDDFMWCIHENWYHWDATCAHMDPHGPISTCIQFHIVCKWCVCCFYSVFRRCYALFTWMLIPLGRQMSPYGPTWARIDLYTISYRMCMIHILFHIVFKWLMWFVVNCCFTWLNMILYVFIWFIFDVYMILFDFIWFWIWFYIWFYMVLYGFTRFYVTYM